MPTVLSPVGLTACLGGIIFNAVDDDGVRWVYDDITGWDDTPDVDGEPVPRPDRDGSYPATYFLQPRALTLTGMFVAPDRLTMYAARARLTTATALLRSDGVLTVNEPIPKQAVVRRNGSVKMRSLSATGVEFSVPLVANDPRKYSAELTTLTARLARIPATRGYPIGYPAGYPNVGVSDRADEVTVDNVGSYPTYPLIRFTAGPAESLPNPGVIHVPTGDRLQIGGTLAPGSVAELDLDNGAVTIDGVPRRTLLTTDSRWFAAEEGVTVLRFVGGTAPTATMTVDYRSAWE